MVISEPAVVINFFMPAKKAGEKFSIVLKEDFGHLLNPQLHKTCLIFTLYSFGVMPVNCLKIKLKLDLELNPEL